MIQRSVRRSICFLLIAALCCGMNAAHAAQIAMDFAGDRQGGAPTANYTSTVLGTTVSVWDHVNTAVPSDWSGGDPTNGIPPTFVDGDTGATISYYYDAANTWTNGNFPNFHPMRGYLDDNLNNQPFVQLGGLSNWLAASGDPFWKMTVLRSTDNGRGFRNLNVGTGPVNNSWFKDTLPTGILTESIAGATLLASPAPISMESAVYYGNSDAMIVYDANFGLANHRGTIAAIILESTAAPTPEPYGDGTISINMAGRNPGYNLAPGAAAGVIPTTNWNNLDNSNFTSGTFGPFPLNDATGSKVANVTWSGTGTWGRSTAGNADHQMMSGHIEADTTGATTVTVTDLADNYAKYNVYVYVGDDAGNRLGELRFNGGPIQNFRSEIFDGTYTVGTDYFLFRHVTGDSFTVSVEPFGDLNANRTGIRGVQIIGVPEPSATVLALFGLVSFAAVRRRKR